MHARLFAWWPALLLAGFCSFSPTLVAAEKLRLLVVHGGHDFETNQFLQLFRDNTNVTFEAVQHPHAHAWWQPETAKAWDVLVLYDLWQEIKDAGKADLVARLKEGKGLLVLHHALANYQSWPEYERIVGGKYYLQKQTVNGVEKPQSTYKHDVEFTVRIANNQHPVTRGLTDFTIHDETYGAFEVSSQTHALLTTEEPTSGKTIAWAKTYEAARVVYVQLGHDHLAYENPHFRRLLANAIQWVAKRD
jgi:hypothetical protein